MSWRSRSQYGNAYRHGDAAVYLRQRRNVEKGKENVERGEKRRIFMVRGSKEGGEDGS